MHFVLVSWTIVQVVWTIGNCHLVLTVTNSLTGWTAAAIVCRVGDLSGLMSNVNYSWLKGTKCVNWRYIWPVFNQLSLTLHGARLRPSSLLLVRVGSRSFLEQVAESARLRVTSLTCSVLCVLVHTWMSNAESSAPLILLVTFCASRSVIADSSAPRYIVANCWPLLPDFTRHYDRPFDVWDRQADLTVDRRKGKRIERTTTIWRSIVSLYFCSSHCFGNRTSVVEAKKSEFKRGDTSESYTKYQCRRIKGRSISNTFETDRQRQ